MSAWTEEERAEALRRRMEGVGAAPLALPAAGGLKFVSKGAAEVSNTGTMFDDFIESETFTGAKEGYVFKMGSDGLGYYIDNGPNKGENFDLNGIEAEYDMEKHARGETNSRVEAPPEPGEGRVGALGDLLAENKAKKQEEFDKLVHDNRFQPPRALDEDEADFLAEKEREREAKRKIMLEQERDDEIQFKLAQQETKPEKAVDLTRIMGQAKSKKQDTRQSDLLSKLIANKRKIEEAPQEPPDKRPKQDAPGGGGNALMGLAAYDDDDSD
mmetsp:Transcript_61367/g.126733  ORF Transcript_61367/g.126733 Transcript_61367/m.126733 type:complete len:271 (+) Transcript_61367:31-843(+)|eukprot:CAMPEP_0181296562 /NCGR_PEP_ID=MMETSP1101-20121128/4771_1 /TAXON_ID=46948 /ORGANISM="Rhodomonas abbreviata, Strain Caron Lab Isolate" /LENGTH=270 /DNA_ID=CAMNT_0023401437 /DNA_START=70 /DNA_END=882 /DNA_ORIENTATION=-